MSEMGFHNILILLWTEACGGGQVWLCIFKKKKKKVK